MTSQMHTELTALIGRYDCGEITDEEWALLQIHMAYCGSCEREFEQRRANETAARLERAANEGRESEATPD